ncbi:MAG: fluoride efflux transporter CrcB [Bifidobacteriaceae bacterium]|jgi:CrcB protein|nr:fluoride efflux transporter CrcB [Bifidobacteriaceae bacterium]
MGEFLLVGIGGAIGCCARYLASKAAAAMVPQFPLGTLLVNCVAAFAAGFLLGVAGEAHAVSERLRVFLGVGLLGGLSTYSAFSVETFTMLTERHYLAAAGNIGLNTGLSLVMVALGWWAARGLVAALRHGA